MVRRILTLSEAVEDSFACEALVLLARDHGELKRIRKVVIGHIESAKKAADQETAHALSLAWRRKWIALGPVEKARAG